MPALEWQSGTQTLVSLCQEQVVGCCSMPVKLGDGVVMLLTNRA